MPIIIGVIILFVVVIVFKSIVIVPQKQACIVERLGKYFTTLEAGFHLLVPFIDTIRYRQNLKEVALDVPPQQCITRDNIMVEIDGILYLQVTDPVKASYGIENYFFACSQLAQTCMTGMPPTTVWTLNSPLVMVPVLSTTTDLILDRASMDCPPLKRMPFLLPAPMPAKKARGTLSTRAQGQLITRNVRAV